MKYLMIMALMFSLGCSSLYKPKRTTFYDKNNRPLKTFVGRGVYDGNERFGNYKIWAMKDWTYYEYHCSDCTYKEEEIKQ